VIGLFLWSWCFVLIGLLISSLDSL
jgi:hypothetical protein